MHWRDHNQMNNDRAGVSSPARNLIFITISIGNVLAGIDYEISSKTYGLVLSLHLCHGGILLVIYIFYGIL